MAPGIARAHISVGLKKRGGNISVVMSLFVLLDNTNFLIFLKPKTENNSLTVYIFNLQNHPTFPLREKFDQVSKRMRVLSWSIYIIFSCISPFCEGFQAVLI